MAELPHGDVRTVEAIYKYYEDKNEEWDSLGVSISQMLEKCGRALWLKFRWSCPPEKKDGRILRLFQTGHIEEDRMLSELRAIGCEVVDYVDGKQIKVYALGGHVRGKLDAEATGIPTAPKTIHVVECKSHNQKSFVPLLKKGVKAAKEVHYVQIQMYMHRRHRTRGLYMAVNKNTDELYTERVYHDPEYCEKVLDRVATVIFNPNAPAKLHDSMESKGAYDCKFCDSRSVCQQGAFARINCRTCLHSSPCQTGGWECEKFSKKLTIDAQKKGCTAHLFHPALVPGKQVDVNEVDGWIEYVLTKDGSVWRDGTSDKYRIAGEAL